jgi:hypothetical protein
VAVAAGCAAPDRNSATADAGAAAARAVVDAAVAVVDAAPSAPRPLAQDAPAEPPSLDVPRAHALIRPTGHFDVNVWGGSPNTHTLLDDAGVGAVPVNECRFLWGQDNLYAFFYAGDLDLQVRATKHDGKVWADDAVTFAFSPGPNSDAGRASRYVVAVNPTGVLADGVCPADAIDLGDPRCDLRWESGARVGTDYDGTINKLGDFDEEWAVEMALPLKAIGIDPHAAPPIHVPMTIRRCEMAHDGPRACGLWGTPGRPADLVLVDR